MQLGHVQAGVDRYGVADQALAGLARVAIDDRDPGQPGEARQG
jgi:hypothetical protein